MDNASDVELTFERDYRFKVDFRLPAAPLIVADATPPLGEGAGPDSEKLLVAAVANCLSASLLFSLNNFKNEPVPMAERPDVLAAARVWQSADIHDRIKRELHLAARIAL